MVVLIIGSVGLALLCVLGGHTTVNKSLSVHLVRAGLVPFSHDISSVEGSGLPVTQAASASENVTYNFLHEKPEE